VVISYVSYGVIRVVCICVSYVEVCVVVWDADCRLEYCLLEWI